MIKRLLSKWKKKRKLEMNREELKPYVKDLKTKVKLEQEYELKELRIEGDDTPDEHLLTLANTPTIYTRSLFLEVMNNADYDLSEMRGIALDVSMGVNLVEHAKRLQEIQRGS